MPKPKYTGGASGKGRPFKKKEGERSSEKPRERRSSGERPERGSNGPDDRKPRTRPGESGGRGFARSGSRDERPSASERKPGGRKPKPFSTDDRPARKFEKSGERPAFKKRDDRSPTSDKPQRKTKPRNFDDKPRRSYGGDKEEGSLGRDKFSERKSQPRNFDDKPRRSFDKNEDRGFDKKDAREERPARDDKKSRGSFDSSERRRAPGAKFDSNARKYGAPKFSEDQPFERKNKKEEGEDIKRVKFDDFEDGKVFSNADKKRPAGSTKTKYKKQTGKPKPQIGDGLTRLNKYLANAGVASRREADTLIQSGVVKVNGVVVDQLGYKISPGDKVTYGDAPVRGERKVYLLLNKPKDYITTVDDPQERKTVMELVSKACRERIYPVGRLDRNTTGLLLFTNDGEMTTRLTHPKFGVKKVYHVSLNKGLKPEDFKAIAEGIELEDGIVKADDVAFVGEGKKEIGIEIHSGRNRIVRRIFEHLGYDVLKLDRVVFAGLTKKDLPRGKHRFLTAKEISFLQMIG
ncbi:MAG TPA: pseudouridine synthase [Bacteroidia bacterium]|nr:pseudouridine synthase [Bacteroidia bacterium]